MHKSASDALTGLIFPFECGCMFLFVYLFGGQYQTNEPQNQFIIVALNCGKWKLQRPCSHLRHSPAAMSPGPGELPCCHFCDSSAGREQFVPALCSLPGEICTEERKRGTAEATQLTTWRTHTWTCPRNHPKVPHQSQAQGRPKAHLSWAVKLFTHDARRKTR